MNRNKQGSERKTAGEEEKKSRKQAKISELKQNL